MSSAIPKTNSNFIEQQVHRSILFPHSAYAGYGTGQYGLIRLQKVTPQIHRASIKVDIIIY